MLREIQVEFLGTERWTGLRAPDARVLEALARVPRDRFIPAPWSSRSFDNRAVSIGHGQTISQPYIVALMSSLLRPQPDDVVLEIGTGSGYQAAVLAELVRSVYSIEIVPALARKSGTLLAELGYANVEVRHGDGWSGWPGHAPYDGIVVTACAEEVPPPLIEQLAPGGRMMIPVGHTWGRQELVLLEKDHRGEVRERPVIPVVFVPFTGEFGTGADDS